MRKKSRKSVWGVLGQEIKAAGVVFHDYFIPHEGNSHKPHILHHHHVKVLASVLLASKVALVIILFSFVPRAAELSPAVEQAMIDLTNTYRQQLQVPTLVRNSYLDSVAQSRAADMIAKNYFSHYDPDGRKPWQWVDSSRYNYTYFGENLAMDFITADAVFKAFVASPAHEKNLRNVNYRDIGVAMTSGVIDGKETNILVVLFGATKPVVVPIVTQEKPVPKPVVQPPKKIPVKVVPPVVVSVPARTVPPTSVSAIKPLADNQPTEVKGVEVQAEPLPVTPTVTTVNSNWLQRLVAYSDDIYFLLLITFIIIALVNIFVAIRVQHRSAIIASLLLIVLTGYLWLANWNAAEGLANGIRVLGISL